MSHDFDFPDVPAPATGSHDHGDDDDSTTKPTSAQHLKQQALLRRERPKLKLHADTFEALRPKASVPFEHCLNATHCGSWDELWPLIHSVQILSFLRGRCSILLGGWLQPVKKAARIKPPPLPAHLVTDVTRYAVGKIVAAKLAAYRSSHRAAPEQADLQEALVTYNDQFGAARTSTGWNLEELDTIITDLCGPAALDHIEWQLSFLKAEMFCFFCDPGLPDSGWDDFFNFAHAYHHLPKTTRDAFGPYHVTIVTH